MPENPSPLPAPMRRLPVIGTVVAGALIGLAGYYGLGGLKRSPGDAACTAAVETAKKIAPLVHGEVAALTMASAPLQLPDLTFEDAQGKPKKLSDWRGKIVLLNLWATWCVPCRKEMPALDSLEGKLGGPGFEGGAGNIYSPGADKPRAWVKEVGIGRRGYYGANTPKGFQGLEVTR